MMPAVSCERLTDTRVFIFFLRYGVGWLVLDETREVR
jgi:hypothetical protein